MSHVTGKLEILGIMDSEIYFKYHETKDRENLGVMFKLQVDEEVGWLNDSETLRILKYFVTLHISN